MISETTAKIIRDICDLNALDEGEGSEWHIGATGNVDQLLFTDLEIPRNYRWCMHRQVPSAREAQVIISAFRNVGFKECLRTGPVDDTSELYVFVYRNAPSLGKSASQGVLRPQS
jgi:hypothetical protein